MSDFDFDALRDPDAPQPGSRERAAVNARARRLRTRTRVSRLAVSATSIVAVIAIVVAVVAARRDPDPSITVAGSTTTTAAKPPPAKGSVAGRFVPPTTTEDGLVVLPVTFPDGEKVTLRYPAAMRVAQLGFAGGIGVNWPAETGTLHCCGKQISITYQTVADVYGDATPVHAYDGANGDSVYYFHSSQALKTITPALDFLVYQFGPWLVQVYDVQQPGDYEDRMTEAQRATWARSLTGTLDDNGYLLLHAAAPLSLGNNFDGGFGDPAHNMLELASHQACNQPESDTNVRRTFENEGGSGVAWCEGQLHVSATGDATFVDFAKNDLQVIVHDVITAPITTTTTTTTTTTAAPTGLPTLAVSATFVSPDHGWALDQSGFVWETTDGGTTWREISRADTQVPEDKRIRFADALHGFEFSTGSGTLTATNDGGHHWNALDPPFSSVFDLAISHGTVYAVAHSAAGNTFRIWSAPADTLAWTEDPLVIPGGAGPDPTVQLVFSGTRGWLVEVDRTVVAGARMSATGQWSAWTPPCSTVNGPAELAASTSTDLVASCNEGVWGPPAQASTLYVSHDGGDTFDRHVAKYYGDIASPNPQTAVVFDHNTLQRTTDDGATWQFVAGLGDNVIGPADIGFTTPTQGFAILGDGVMQMTHDAGATWQPVTR